MKSKGCGFDFFCDFSDDVLECGDCGNHVCKNQAIRGGGICPHCFGKLYHVN